MPRIEQSIVGGGTFIADSRRVSYIVSPEANEWRVHILFGGRSVTLTDTFPNEADALQAARRLYRNGTFPGDDDGFPP